MPLIAYLAMGMWLVYAIRLILRTHKDLTTPDEQLPAGSSRVAAWGGLGLGIVLLGFVLVFFIGPMIISSPPTGQYGTVNGRPITKAQYDACGGNPSCLIFVTGGGR